jgi:HTH-type transcriptional regulator, competence development regulator
MDEMDLPLNKLLQNTRYRKMLSLRVVEQATGISNSYLSQVEHGKIKKPSPDILYKLAKIYNLDYSFLMQKAGYVTPVRFADEEGITLEGYKITDGQTFCAIYKLTPLEQEKLKQYLYHLRNQNKAYRKVFKPRSLKELELMNNAGVHQV